MFYNRFIQIVIFNKPVSILNSSSSPNDDTSLTVRSVSVHPHSDVIIAVLSTR